MTPLDRIMNAQGLTNQGLVAASREQLTFKQVQKARAGRAITSNIQGKILRALDALVPGAGYRREDLFPLIVSSEGGHRAGHQP